MKPRTSGRGNAEAVAENAEYSGCSLREADQTSLHPFTAPGAVMRPKEAEAERGVAGRTESAAERETSLPSPALSPSVNGVTRNSILSPPRRSPARRRMVTVRLLA